MIEAPRPIELSAERPAQRRGLDPGSPEYGRRVDPFTALEGHAMGIDAGHQGIESHIDAEPLEVSLRVLRE